MLQNMCMAIIKFIRPDDISASPIMIDVNVLFDLRGRKRFDRTRKIPKINEKARKFVYKLAKLKKYSLIMYLGKYLDVDEVKIWLKRNKLDKYFQYFYFHHGACCMEINKKILKHQSFDEILEFLDKNNLTLHLERKITYLKNFPIPKNWRDYIED